MKFRSMKPTLTRTLCLSAFALLLFQGALLNCAACGHNVDAVVAHVECDHHCHDHDSGQLPTHRCEMHRATEVLNPSRTDVRSFTFDLVPTPNAIETLIQQSHVALFVPHYTAPPDPGWRDVGTIIIRC